MDEDVTEFPTQRVRLQPCQICGRQFNVETLKKHQAICRKVTTKQRKVFDAGKQRSNDSDVPYKATKRTAQIQNGEIRPQDDKSKSKSKTNWRDKHRQLIQSVREARSVTRAIKEGGPLPVFRPSEVPSDYVACPYCHRNFNEHVAKRHMPFCQTQHQRKQPQPTRSNQQIDRGRTLPPQYSTPQKQQSSSSDMYSNQHDVYNNGYKHSNSAPMIVRRNPSELQQPPPRKTTGGGGWGGFKKLFGLNSKEGMIPTNDYYTPEDEDDYEPPARRPTQQHQPPVLMRTGRTHENTGLNVRARQKSDGTNSYQRRGPPPPPAPPQSYNQTRSHYGNGNGQYNSSRPTAVGRPPPPPPPQSSGVRCGECGSLFNNASARYCAQCGSRR